MQRQESLQSSLIHPNVPRKPPHRTACACLILACETARDVKVEIVGNTEDRFGFYMAWQGPAALVNALDTEVAD